MLNTLQSNRFRYTDAGGSGSWVTHYFGVLGSGDAANPPPPIGTLHPVAFLVEMDPERILRPHFHTADQFQLFVTGDGSFGQETLRVLSLHYADAYTPYGPIRSGDEGLGYFTLRNGWDLGINFMPESRETLRAARRKPRALNADVPACDGNGETVILALGSDGVYAARIKLAPGATFTGPDPASSGGQYWVRLPPGRTPYTAWQQHVGLAFVTPSDPPRSITASRAGEDFFLLQFPRHSTVGGPAFDYVSNAR
jgi:hypothetical protein